MPKERVQPGELALIARIRRTGWGKSPFVRLGIGDDCAVLRPPSGSDVIVTTDFTLEGRHFRRDWHSPESVGHRCLARGLSDLAAMGAQPLAAFLSLALPATMPATAGGRRWVDGFFNGLQRLAADHKVELAGGDTAQSPTDLILADIQLVGAAPRGRELRRSGARPGDLLYVTGALGGAAAELEILRRTGLKKVRSLENHPQLFPAPRLAQGRALMQRRLASACMDLSDGLSTDLAHLCRASVVGAVIEVKNLPLHPLALKAKHLEPVGLALDGGEDYELLFAAHPTAKMPRSIAGIPITCIGQCTAQPEILIEDPSGIRTPLTPGGWEHFRS